MCSLLEVAKANDVQKKSRALDDLHSKFGERDGDLERLLRDKEEELEISKAELELHAERLVR